MFGIRPGLTAQNDLFGTRSNNGQSNAYFGFGDVTGGYGLVQYNRKLAFSSNTESSNSDFTTGAKIPQGFSSFSNYTQRMYIFSGYVNPGLDSNTNYSSITSNTQGTISSSWAGTTRRGGVSPAAYFGIRFDQGASGSNQVWYGGYSDNTGLYYGTGNYLSTSTETGGSLTSLSYTCHVGAGFASYQKAYFVGGINNGTNISTISYRDWSTGSVSTLSTTDTNVGYYGYGLANWGYGYRFGGVGGINATDNMRFNFYNETRQSAAALSGSSTLFAGVTSASSVFGYIWTGYQNTLNRFLNLYSWSTSTVSNNSYTTADTNNGWITANAGV